MTKILPRAAFVLSVGVLGFVYGFAAEAWNLFPRAHVEQAWRQARALYVSSSRHFLSDKVYDRSGVRIADSANVQAWTEAAYLLVEEGWGLGHEGEAD